MNPVEDLRAAFSRYELAVIGYVLTCVLAGGGVLFVFLGYWGGLILWLLALPTLFFFHAVSACPTCGKYPGHYYPLGEHGWPGKRLRFKRLWPERQCSGCGTALDGI